MEKRAANDQDSVKILQITDKPQLISAKADRSRRRKGNGTCSHPGVPRPLNISLVVRCRKNQKTMIRPREFLRDNTTYGF